MIQKLYEFNADGWYPRLDEAGETVCFGNLSSRAWHIGGGEWPPVEGRNSRFIRPGVVTFTRELDTLHAKRFERALSNNHVDPMDDDTALVAGNDFDAGNGHWSSCLASGRLVLHGSTILSGDRYRGVQAAGPFVLSSRNDTHFDVFERGLFRCSLPLPPGANAWRIAPTGHITSGYFWDSKATWIDGSTQDITVTPWRREGPPVLVLRDHILWAWTYTHLTRDIHGVVGMPMRAWGKTLEETPFEAIVLQGWDASSWLDVKWDAIRGRFVLAGSGDRGQLQVWAVTADHARTDLFAWWKTYLPGPEPKPEPVPDPKPEEPKETPTMLTDAHKALRGRWLERFPIPSKRADESSDAWEDRLRREWTIPFVQQMMFSFHGDGFCVKSADAGRPESKDAMGRVIGGTLHYYDLLLGAGTGRPTLVEDPPAIAIPGQHIRREHGPVDRLGGGGEQPGDPGGGGGGGQQPGGGDFDWPKWAREVLEALRALKVAIED